MQKISLILLLMMSINVWGESSLPEFDQTLPITIDADSSEFDYATNRLVFSQLRLDQGNLGIKADHAETDKLDFTDGVWFFRGNVSMDADNAQLTCDSARLTFIDHQLTEIELTGSPAHFNQYIEESEQTNAGQANLITYSLASGNLRLEDNAQFNDGANEISGDLITYDLIARRLTAGSGSSGPVKIIIEAPADLKEKADKP